MHAYRTVAPVEEIPVFTAQPVLCNSGSGARRRDLEALAHGAKDDETGKAGGTDWLGGRYLREKGPLMALFEAQCRRAVHS